jgi:hypothetical protein
MTLREDSQVTAYRVGLVRKKVAMINRLILRLAFPLSVSIAIVCYLAARHYEVELGSGTILTILIGPSARLGILNLFPLFEKLVRVQWELLPDKIKMRGSAFGTVRRDRIVGVQRRTIREMPDHYECVMSFRSGRMDSIILHAETYPWEKVSAEFAVPASSE